ncbi:Cytochrome [Abeliophyllum distichum]|uniref:Cytochrome n=1 Tax=Abeliophyllum distichum TaxID=126358 RepID=A0ABD1TVN2_9LAMI
MVELLKNPKTMKNVRREIEISEDFPKNSHLMQLPYLEARVKETLRLHPPAAFLLPHWAIETCQVMNYTVPKNAQVVVTRKCLGYKARSIHIGRVTWVQTREFCYHIFGF